jgi:hypothetical protein
MLKPRAARYLRQRAARIAASSRGAEGDEAISAACASGGDCFASLAMTRILAHKKNTGDLQGENPQKYNIRSCNREKKGNRPETIRNNEKNRRKRSKNNAPGDRAPRGNEKPADEQRRATDRTNRRLGFQPSPILREKASERKKRSRYSCGALVRFSPDVVFDRLVLRSDHPACSRSIQRDATKRSSLPSVCCPSSTAPKPFACWNSAAVLNTMPSVTFVAPS